MRIVFLGNNWLGWKIAEYLVDLEEKIVCLVMNPLNKRKFGQNILSCSKIDKNFMFESSQLSDPSVLNTVSDLKPDLALSVLFGTILKSNFINIFPKGVINLHPSYLPFNRGAYPNVWSILEKTPAGATIHYIDEEIDTGDIIAQKQVTIEPFDTGKSLYKKTEDTALGLFKDTWPKIKSGNFERRKQLTGKGTFHYINDVNRIDEINLSSNYKAGKLIDILRARTFPPHNGAFFKYNGCKIFLRLELIPEENLEGENGSDSDH